MKKTLKFDDHTVTYKDTKEIRDLVFERVMAFFIEHNSFNGESIYQCDGPLIDAPSVLSDIAEDIIKFKTKYKDE